MMFLRVLLLHHELRDYSLGQIAFAVFKRYWLSYQNYAGIISWSLPIIPSQTSQKFSKSSPIIPS